jgi:hypothetical protein
MRETTGTSGAMRRTSGASGVSRSWFGTNEQYEEKEGNARLMVALRIEFFVPSL